VPQSVLPRGILCRNVLRRGILRRSVVLRRGILLLVGWFRQAGSEGCYSPVDKDIKVGTRLKPAEQLERRRPLAGVRHGSKGALQPSDDSELLVLTEHPDR